MAVDRPNVVLAVSDQHRARSLGCGGNPTVHTPNVDRLATEGTRFENCYANDPLCTPSRGCLLTGQYPFEHGAFTNEMPLREDVPTLAKTLSDAGYRTGYVGKWHLDGPVHDWIPPGPRRQGFDDFWVVNHAAHDYWDATHYGDEASEPVSLEGYTPAAQTDLALDFLDSDDDRPFCLVLSWGPPHAPYGDVPAAYRDRYDPDDIPLPANVEPILGGPRFYGDGTDSDQDTLARETVADYYAQVTAVDDQLGRLLDGLDDRGLAEDTVVAYTSDHGDMLWSQGREKKSVPWAEATNVPLVVRWPGEVPAGRVTETLASTVDVAPSLVSLAGATPDDDVQGVDLADPMRGGGEDGPDSVYLMRCASPGDPDEWRAVRTRQYTYAELLDGTPWLLYDEAADPDQRTNLVGDPAHRDIRGRLAAEVDAWADRVGDPRLDGEALAREQDRLADLYAQVGYVMQYW